MGRCSATLLLVVWVPTVAAAGCGKTRQRTEPARGAMSPASPRIVADAMAPTPRAQPRARIPAAPPGEPPVARPYKPAEPLRVIAGWDALDEKPLLALYESGHYWRRFHPMVPTLVLYEGDVVRRVRWKNETRLHDRLKLTTQELIPLLDTTMSSRFAQLGSHYDVRTTTSDPTTTIVLRVGSAWRVVSVRGLGRREQRPKHRFTGFRPPPVFLKLYRQLVTLVARPGKPDPPGLSCLLYNRLASPKPMGTKPPRGLRAWPATLPPPPPLRRKRIPILTTCPLVLTPAQAKRVRRFLKKSPLFLHRGVRFRGTLESLLPAETYLQKVITTRR